MDTKHARYNEEYLSGLFILSDRDFCPIGIPKRREWLRALPDNPNYLGMSDQNHRDRNYVLE